MTWVKNLIGAGLVGLAWGATTLWNSAPPRSPLHQTVYDTCLVQNAGNVVACDASMRLLALTEARDERTKRQALQMRLNGSPTRDIVTWVTKQGLVGSDIAEAAGISLETLCHWRS